MDAIPPKSESFSVIWDVAAANERVSEPLSPTSVDLAARNEATVENVGLAIWSWVEDRG
jgi:hypothetical protein